MSVVLSFETEITLLPELSDTNKLGETSFKMFWFPLSKAH